MSRIASKADRLKRLITLYDTQDMALMGHDAMDREILTKMTYGLVGREIYYLEDVKRLMPIAKEAILKADESGLSHRSGCVWLAESLIGAKGRMEREWWSPSGGVYLCIAIYPALCRELWPFYSLGIGVAITQVLREWGVPALVRWINDVLVGGKKVAGTLTEAVRCHGSGEDYILFGIGLNVNIETFPPYLTQASSLAISTGRKWPALELTAHILSRIGIIFAMLHRWEQSSIGWGLDDMDANPVLMAFRLVSDTLGKSCLYGLDADNHPEFMAVAKDIAYDGSLILAFDDGDEIKVNTGEIRYKTDA